MKSIKRIALAALIPIFGIGWANRANAQVGPILSGSGPVNRSMGGVAVANSLSASGSLLWNPASLSGLKTSQLEASAEFLFPSTSLSSSVDAGAFGQLGPPVDLRGTTDSDDSVFALPSVALAFRGEDSPVTFGLGVFAVAGFGLNYAGSDSNPLLTPPAPNGLGFGPIFSEYEVLQIAPAIVYDVSDRLSFSFSPLLNIASIKLDPLIVAPPDDANGDGFATHRNGTHAQTAFGAGFGVGTFYQSQRWSLGASYKSPQWFESFEVNSSDENGVARLNRFGLDLPAITSVGASYVFGPNVLLATDVRYYDFENARGFGDRGFSPAGGLEGVSFDSVFGVGVGLQMILTETLTTRVGYNWNENPIDDEDTSINIASPLIIEHQISTGFTYQVSKSLDLSAAYLYAFENSISGPLVLPSGPAAGTSVTSRASAHSAIFGATVRFGS